MRTHEIRQQSPPFVFLKKKELFHQPTQRFDNTMLQERRCVSKNSTNFFFKWTKMTDPLANPFPTSFLSFFHCSVCLFVFDGMRPYSLPCLVLQFTRARRRGCRDTAAARTTTAARRGFLLFGFDFGDDAFHFVLVDRDLFSALPNDDQFYGLGTGIDHLQQDLYRQPHGLRFGHVGGILLLQELSQRLGVPSPDGLRLPAGVGTGGIGLVQVRSPRTGRVGAQARHQRRDAKGTDAALLRVLLLDLGHVPGQVIHRRRIFHGQPERLRLDADLVDEDARVGRQPRERQHRVVVDGNDFAYRAGVL